jgi:hypothetical protein
VKHANLFIPGAPKAGTTTIYSYLAQSNDVYCPDVKEPHYWSRLTPDRKRKKHLNVISGEDDYAALFVGCNDEKYRIDGSTSYLYSAEALDSIRLSVPDAKFIVVLREPVSRAFSQFQMDVRAGLERNREFLSAVEVDLARGPKRYGENGAGYVEFGMYSNHLRGFLSNFNSDSLLILYYEELVSDRQAFFSKINAFLGIGNESLSNDIHGNRSVVLRYPKLYQYAYSLASASIRSRIPSRLKSAAKAMLTKEDVVSGDVVMDSCRFDSLIEFFSDDVRALDCVFDKYGIESPYKYWLKYES